MIAKRILLLVGVELLFGGIAAAQTNAEFPVLAVSRQEQSKYDIVTERTLRDDDWQAIEKRVAEVADQKIGSFPGQPTDGRPVKIHYRTYVNRNETKGGVVITSGRTEGLVLYQETIYDLVRNGYSVYIYDHRGQGFSSRLLTDDAQAGYVDDFDKYVADLDAFVQLVKSLRTSNAKPLFLLSHSMGGTVAALSLRDLTVQNEFAAAAFVTPMFEPWASGGSTDFARVQVQKICDKWAVSLPFAVPWLSARYIDSAKGPFDAQYREVETTLRDPKSLEAAVKRDGTTSSTVRYVRNWKTRASATCSTDDCGNADAKVGGATLRWVNQACAASKIARTEAATQVRIPVLVLQGGADKAVFPPAQSDYCRRVNQQQTAGGFCVPYRIEGAKHAVLIEDDAYRIPALARILSFFDCVIEKRGAACRQLQ